MIKAFSLSQLPAGHLHQVSVGDYDVLLANVDGEVFAVENKCSHYGLPLVKGALCGHRVRCPFHHACFDVRSGEQLEAPGLDGLPSFPVKVEGDEIWVGETPTVTNQGLALGDTPAPASSPQGDHYDYVLIGGGVAAAYAAEAIREIDEKSSLLLISKEELPPYDRTKVSKALMAGGAEVASLPLRSKAFYEKNGVLLKMGSAVSEVDVRAKKVSLEGDESLTYGKILLATGGTPRQLKVPGNELDNVFYVRNAADGEAARKATGEGTEVVISGGSFIGLEAAMSLGKQGAKITVVTPEEVLFSRVFGEDIGRYVQQLHEAAGVTFRLGRKVQEITGDGKVAGVVLDNGDELAAEVLVVGIGVQPATGYLTGLAARDDGSILVDNHLRGDADGLFVAGDIATYPGREGAVRIEHWKVAAQQGRIAGRNMAGKSEPYEALPFFWSNQQGVNFRYAGHGTDYDRVLIEGTPGETPFLAFYVKNAHVQAVLGVKRDGDTAAIAELMETGKMPAVDALLERDWMALLRA